MDAMGHVNNTVYFRYMEQTRIGWFEALLPRGEAWGTTGIVIVNASCNFKKPINYPGTVEVKMYADAPGVEPGDVLRSGAEERGLCRWRGDGRVHRHGEAEGRCVSRRTSGT